MKKRQRNKKKQKHFKPKQKNYQMQRAYAESIRMNREFNRLTNESKD